MKVGETIRSHDLAEALRGEQGKFEVVTPNDEVLRVTCKPGHSISNLEYASGKKPPELRMFTIRKIAEPVLATTASAGMGNGGWAE